MDNLTGKDLGRYHIVQALGEGGMASVYKAYDTRLERYVAIKVIRVEKDQDPNFLKRFEREAKALARLSHPNIVHVNDYGEQDGVPYLVMDYLPGGTLKPKMGQPMPFHEAAKILIPMARALHHAHQNGIVHRDVKPANMLLTAGGEPMLSDFGIAKMLESEQTSELTGTGIGIGTPEYMAPEQGTGDKVDERADIYSLGVVFYELVTGRKPFRADTPMAVVIKQITEPLPNPNLYVPNLPQEVEQVIFKAMAKNPDDRYQTMELFAQGLEHLLQLPAQTVAIPATPAQTQAQAARIPQAQPEKHAAAPAMGTVALVVIALVLLGALGLCGLGAVFGINIFKPAQPALTVSAQTTNDKTQNTAGARIKASTVAAARPSQAAASTPEPTQPALQTEPSMETPTSEVMTISGNGMTSVILVNRDGTAAAGDSKEITESTIPAGVDSLMIYFSWDAGSGSLDGVVTMPDGKKITSQTSRQGMQIISNSSTVGFMVTKPPAGLWKFNILNVKPNKDTMKYHFMVQYSQLSQ